MKSKTFVLPLFLIPNNISALFSVSIRYPEIAVPQKMSDRFRSSFPEKNARVPSRKDPMLPFSRKMGPLLRNRMIVLRRQNAELKLSRKIRKFVNR